MSVCVEHVTHSCTQRGNGGHATSRPLAVSSNAVSRSTSITASNSGIQVSYLACGSLYPDWKLVSLIPYTQMPKRHLKSGHCLFPPLSFQFIIHSSSNHKTLSQSMSSRYSIHSLNYFVACLTTLLVDQTIHV